MNTNPRRAPSAVLLRRLRIAGYCGLAAIALALFVAMCAILADSALDRQTARPVMDDGTELHGGTPAAGSAAPAQAGPSS
ncbi:hypothetical protein Bsp3421_000915 [Burkholderia sp. FERM BP-3421]|jgi:hypothetical protein|uniref:hypothetical protein n=1 Tax=Burkholderia sp. FERM BP-3421 TaxID=1494466 RepID=UPI00235E503E|nr:hypothetical protein [Burkholderia sp. FERM BP-3421]WDD91026.1 hypothetical protein Bsp3421_000915 [Burkholderia sp. FERM BP-3421]